MKKVLVLATAAFLTTGFAFANNHDGDKNKKKATCDKACCKGKECKKDDKKETKATAKDTKTTLKLATKKA